MRTILDKKILPLAKPMELISKYRFVLLIAAVGILLMLMPSFGGEKRTRCPHCAAANAADFSVEQTQKSLKSYPIIDGVGRVRVMLTVASGMQRACIKATGDLLQRVSGSTPEDYSALRRLYCWTAAAAETNAADAELYPPYVGALVVCDGAGDSGTVLKVKEAVSVLTGLGSDCISVARRTES